MTGPLTGSVYEDERQPLHAALRYGGIQWNRENSPNPITNQLWRGKPYQDGIVVDLDDADVQAILVREVARAFSTMTAGQIAELLPEDERGPYWARRIHGYFAAEIQDGLS